MYHLIFTAVHCQKVIHTGCINAKSDISKEQIFFLTYFLSITLKYCSLMLPFRVYCFVNAKNEISIKFKTLIKLRYKFDQDML